MKRNGFVRRPCADVYKRQDLVFAAMPDAVQRLGAPDKTVVTGNPVREEMFRQDRPAARDVYKRQACTCPPEFPMCVCGGKGRGAGLGSVLKKLFTTPTFLVYVAMVALSLLHLSLIHI